MNQQGDIVIYRADDGMPGIRIRLQNETLWLDQYQISDLFQTDRTSIVRHIRNIYRSGELSEDSTCAIIAQVQEEGGRRVKRQVRTYNLDLIISVGYRVNSVRGTQFRIWANNVIREHLVSGFTVNDRRLRELRKAVEIVHRASDLAESGQEAKGLLDVLSDY